MVEEQSDRIRVVLRQAGLSDSEIQHWLDRVTAMLDFTPGHEIEVFRSEEGSIVGINERWNHPDVPGGIINKGCYTHAFPFNQVASTSMLARSVVTIPTNSRSCNPD